MINMHLSLLMGNIFKSSTSHDTHIYNTLLFVTHLT